MTNEELKALIDGVEPMFKARSSEVYDIGDDKVLKLYFDDVDADNLEIEYKNTCTAFELGCTPMECYGKYNIDGRLGLVFKKLQGIALTDAPTSLSPAFLFKGGRIIAELHAMVHEKHAPELRDVRTVAVETIEKNPEIFAFLSAEDKKKAEDYIMALPEADNLIHLDFHTDNILVDGDNNQVIDWMTACKGSPLAEVAMMNFLFHDAELFPGSSKLKIFLLGTIRVFIYNGYMKNYTKLTGIKEEDSAPWNIVAYVLRLGLWNIASEKEFLSGKIADAVKEIK